MALPWQWIRLTYKEDIVPPSDSRHRDRSHLADHRVEGEADHDTDRNALGTSAGVEYLGWDNPWEKISVVSIVSTILSHSQVSGPLVALKLKLYSQVMIVKPQPAPTFVDTPGG
jgi:hypothetical protein